jgi:hypothetical protein
MEIPMFKQITSFQVGRARYTLALITASALAAAPDPTQLLQRSDQARGGGLPGLTWELRVENSGGRSNDDDPPMRLLIQAADDASLAETLEPLRSKGARMLQVERNMWLTKPGLKKPVPISPRQRLTGQASIGDIAATNYAKDYRASLVREEAVNGERCYVLQLTATTRQATYDRVLYWVSAGRGTAVQAEFQSLSGKKLKSAQFEYGNRIESQGRTIPFVSRMVISDALTDARSTLDYGHIVVKAVPAATFDVSNLE